MRNVDIGSKVKLEAFGISSNPIQNNLINFIVNYYKIFLLH